MTDFEYDIKECVKTLASGGTILYPTDTVWGLGCDALDENAIKKLLDLKHRPPGKSFIVLLADSRDIMKYVAAPPLDIISIAEEFERPTTVIYNNPLGFPELLVGDYDTIAIRVTQDPFCRALIKRLQRPIVSTSANISGMPAGAIFADVADEIKQGVDYVVKYRQDDKTINAPSRLVKMTDGGEMEILRP